MENEVKNGRYVDALGTVRWYKDGQLHREDGPAIEYASGKKEWWVNGVEYTEELFNKYQLNKKLEATLEEKPSIKRAKI